MARKVIVYQVWAPSWPNLTAMIKHLHRIARLGITHVWFSGMLESPWYDHGYDISNHYQISHRFGDMEQFDTLVKTAHRLGLGVLIDLVLNHTSTEHPWFRLHPEYYCWNKRLPGWDNLFGDTSAWEYHPKQGMYYLHLFHKSQADLNWFPDGQLNQELVKKFRGIIHFWTKRHKVDGFRLDVPQALNKDISSATCTFDSLLFGDRDDQVLNAVFPDRDKAPFLMMECFDPTFGELVNHYVDETPVQYVMNVLLKDTITSGEDQFLKLTLQSEECHGFMLNTEDHDSPRFTSRAHMEPTTALFHLFNSQANAVCLYQGQELGLSNPHLSQEEACRLDVWTATRIARGESFKTLKNSTRANARTYYPVEECERQMAKSSSCWNLTRELIARYLKL